MNVYITAAKRSAIGKFGGCLSPLSASELGAQVIKAILDQSRIDPSTLDEVIVGNILMAGQRQGVARQVAIKGGIPETVPAYGINMICGSGMKSILSAYQAIASGCADLIIAGGTESMSNAGFVLPGGIRTGYKMGDLKALDHMVCDGLTDAFSGQHMGITAENIAERYGITREEQDRFAIRSQEKAIAAIDGGQFVDEIVDIQIQSKKETLNYHTDEFPNRNSTLEKLGTLRPAFKPDGTVTAGNASGINDGAAFVLLASEEAIAKYGLTPLVRIVSCGQGGVDPNIMGMGPVPAIAQALTRAQLKLSQIEILELNEAFAAQSLGVMRQLIADHHVDAAWFDTYCNLKGGAIALGHPIGASGCRITVSLIHSLLQRQERLGMASLCIGGGMGTAIIVERI